MHTQVHTLLSPSCGTQRIFHSLHYTPQGLVQEPTRKVYMQTSLHADEIPGMLVLYHLRQMLDAAEADGSIAGTIVLVPLANPLGLDQSLMHTTLGRFEQTSMENFNRNYPDLFEGVREHVEPQLSADAKHNTQVVREAMQHFLTQHKPQTELQSLRKALMQLACDADVVLDLHCDLEAELHLYVGQDYVDLAHDLCCYMGCKTVLYAPDNGGTSFDEALSHPWNALRAQSHFPIDLACLAVTLELRGQSDVYHDLARQDAHNLFCYLQNVGVVKGQPSPVVPLSQFRATPLAGTMPLQALHAGIVVFLHSIGSVLTQGEVVAHLIDPLTQQCSEVLAPITGRLYARQRSRYVSAGAEIARLAGAEPVRSGYLLSP